MTTTRENHYVPVWHQKGFMDGRDNHLCYLTRREFPLKNSEVKIVNEKKWYNPTQKLYLKDLYSILFDGDINDDIERKLFGPIDDNGSRAVRAFLTDDQGQWHHNFKEFFTYLDAQKLRTPKGLEWIKTQYHGLTQENLMVEMQSLRTMHCTLWAEGVREFVSAEDSDVKFITSDHPVTIYNYACPPDSDACLYPRDPDISLKGSQTIFPLDKNRCLILTNLEYARSPENVNPLEQRTNATRLRQSMVNTINFINTRKLTREQVIQINYIIKSRSKECIAAGREEWLFPEDDISCDWSQLKNTLLPQLSDLFGFGGEMFVKFDDGSVHYQDEFGRTTYKNEYLMKKIDESQMGCNDPCGCGSGKKYKKCCKDIPVGMRTTWDFISIRERNICFCQCIKDVLGLNNGKSWDDVRKGLSEKQVREIYEFYEFLWPKDTDIYSLLPKPDGKSRALYSGLLDIRAIYSNAVPMSSFFDEFIIQSPVTNPINIKPEFNPIHRSEDFKYQALKEFLFMLELEPFIDKGLVNIIPDPTEFDIQLKLEMMRMVKKRRHKQVVYNGDEFQYHCSLIIQDVLNSSVGLPREAKVNYIAQQMSIDFKEAELRFDDFEKVSENSPLMMLQDTTVQGSGQVMFNKMEPNYELSLFIAQVTGSVVVTDSFARWEQLMSAQHRELGMISFPWGEMLLDLNKLPIDAAYMESFCKSQGVFANIRNLIRSLVRMLDAQDYDVQHLSNAKKTINEVMAGVDQSRESLIMRGLKISCPKYGFHDDNVQRLLLSSSCLKYKRYVTAIIGIDI
ncbi:DUF4238 domain-containing protein [Enterobacter hormaechei subsp. xiangfangensis]